MFIYFKSTQQTLDLEVNTRAHALHILIQSNAPDYYNVFLSMCLNRGRGEGKRGGNEDEILMNLILVLFKVGGGGFQL